jgi:hypothetical protein
VGLNTTGSGSGSSTTGSGSGGGTVSIGSGGGLKLASLASSTPGADIYINGTLINLGERPALCTDSFSVDGVSQPVADLFQTLAPSSWATAQQVNATICGATAGLNMSFPQATINLLADLQTTGNVNIQGSGNSSGGGIIGPLPIPIDTATIGPGMSAINLASSGLILDKGCYQSSNGASFANANIVVPSVSSGSDSIGLSSGKSGNLGLVGSVGTISPGSNATLSSPTGSVLISAGTAGGSVNSGGGALVLVNASPNSGPFSTLSGLTAP